jgi:glycosyltransferase involved in cell wall biosynthesis
MQHSFSATNPCHVYDLALALWKKDALGCYYSGYPRWRLKSPPGFPLRQKPFRTVVTYGMQRLPEALRIEDERMFRWQDDGFDRAVAGVIKGSGFIHGLPRQCRDTFARAREIGLTTVVNHASGPLAQQRALLLPEYERAGLDMESVSPLPESLQQRLADEMQLADFHCVASTVVRDQLVADGVPADRIWIVPYGADQQLFPKRPDVPAGPFRIGFAGRQSLRKGVHYLLKALEQTDSEGWELHCFGMQFAETREDFRSYRGKAHVRQRGSLSQAAFSEALGDLHVLVLPSVEEAFGLVVVQALQRGVPCIVSDRVGAKDLIREGETGSEVPFGETGPLMAALQFWHENRVTVPDMFPWSQSAERLVEVAVTQV